jgi:hypothetical protein
MPATRSPKLDKCVKRAARLYMENWAATADSVRRILRTQGFPDEMITKAFEIAHITD